MNKSDLTTTVVIEALNKTNNFSNLMKVLKVGQNKGNRDLIIEFIKENDIIYPSHFGRITSFSILAKLSKDELQDIVDSSSNYTEILHKFDLRIAGSNSKTLKNILLEKNISLEKYNENKRLNVIDNIQKLKELNHEILTYEDIKIRNFATIRRYILKNKLIQYQCSICGNSGFHLNKNLTLELDHIDGNRYNNELDNLRFLCPNCHSQTETFGRKTRVANIEQYCECGNKLGKNNLSGTCSSCISKNRKVNRKFEISKEELEKLVLEKPLTHIGKIFGVSDTAIKKRCKKLGILLKSK